MLQANRSRSHRLRKEKNTERKEGFSILDLGAVGCDFGGEKALKLDHGGVHDFFVGLGDPVHFAARDWRARRKH